MAFRLFSPRTDTASTANTGKGLGLLQRRIALLLALLLIPLLSLSALFVSAFLETAALKKLGEADQLYDGLQTLGRTLPRLTPGDAALQTVLDGQLRKIDESLQSMAESFAHDDSAEHLEKLQKAWTSLRPELQKFLTELPSDPVQAATTLRALEQGLDSLFGEAHALRQSVQQSSDRAIATHQVTTFTTVAMFVVFLLVAKFYLDDTRTWEAELERQRQQVEAENARTQQAIMQLLNEMSDLAEGDLTIRATVTEDITGAIADSVNYAIEELGSLVRRINDTAESITESTEEARRISGELLEAAQTQAGKIEEADNIVQDMAQALRDTAASAEGAAAAAGRSLEASAKGTEAVSETIQGMNRIRDQIQETAKRIKRLGESSQEIGEIVELISDITDQTNVLALNAAIQAAAAGEAGRGFTVVAEEVQRLAERSAEATKQIAAIVKTIQTDTQDAVGSMEAATREVVAGTALSDSAGAALEEISQVAKETATRITQIAQDIQAQAERGAQVSALMREILAITQQTRQGTERTVHSIESLAELAADLRGSVAGFRV